MDMFVLHKQVAELKELMALVKSSLELATRYALDEPEMVLKNLTLSPQMPELLSTPWPQPSPRFPGVDAPTVLRFSDEERKDFATHVLSRYAKQICVEWPDVVRESLAQSGLEEVTDSEFSSYFADSVFSRFLREDVNERERALFSDVLQASGTRRILKADLSANGLLEPLDGLYCAGTVALFAMTQDRPFVLECIAIAVNETVLEPCDGDAWDLAKYYVLQNAGITTTLLAHPRVHFPMDSINSITKALLPKNHVLYRLLEPHMWLTLPLNRRVQWSPHSILCNPQDLIYTPYPSTGDSNARFKALSISGWEDNASYPKYSFSSKPEKTFSALGDFLNGYYEAILEFCRPVAATVRRDDAAVLTWARFIAQHIDGFPPESEIMSGDNLARALAFYIYDVSVLHATDHYSYSSLPIRKVPLRLRVAPPSSKKIPRLERKTLISNLDFIRHNMAHRMFFSPSNLSLLIDVRYSFGDDKLKQDAHAFQNRLSEIDNDSWLQKFAPLREISASIQY